MKSRIQLVFSSPTLFKNSLFNSDFPRNYNFKLALKQVQFEVLEYLICFENKYYAHKNILLWIGWRRQEQYFKEIWKL